MHTTINWLWRLKSLNKILSSYEYYLIIQDSDSFLKMYYKSKNNILARKIEDSIWIFKNFRFNKLLGIWMKKNIFIMNILNILKILILY